MAAASHIWMFFDGRPVFDDSKWQGPNRLQRGCWMFGLLSFLGGNFVTSWWLNQPIWKICSSKWKIFPNFRGENRKYVKPPPRYIYTLKEKLLFGKCHLSSFQKRCHTVSRWDDTEKKTARNGILWKVYHRALDTFDFPVKLTSYQHYPRFKRKLVGLALYHKPNPGCNPGGVIEGVDRGCV